MAETKLKLASAEAIVKELTSENAILRGLLSKLGAPCVHCGLTEIAKCERGFPGCAQADDILCADEAIHGDVVDRLRKAEARVKELEGLKIIGRGFMPDCKAVTVIIPMESDPKQNGTLGDAMPRKEWGPYKLHDDGWYRLQAPNEATRKDGV